jgi:GLPGLI family protein
MDFKKLDTMKVNGKKMDRNTRIHLKKLYENMKSVEGVLEFSNNEALYTVKKPMENDNRRKINLTYSAAGGEKVYYKNNRTKEYYHQSNTMGDLLLIGERPIEWKITQETKKIGDYVCFKAIYSNSTNKKQKPIAWFAPQIPANFGPKKYVGLPGLILEVKEYSLSFKATKIELNPKKNIKIKKPTKGKKLTYEEYRKMTKKFWNSLGKD